MNKTNEPHNYLGGKHCKERTASTKVLRSEPSRCGSKEKKWTSVARDENKRTNIRVGWIIRSQKDREGPDPGIILRSLDFIVSVNEAIGEF